MSKQNLILVLAVLLAGCRTEPANSTRETVGRHSAHLGYTPVNQILTPSGLQIELPGMRPQALALSPDGKLLVTAGKTHDLVVINPTSGAILQHVPLPSEKDQDSSSAPVSGQILNPDKEGQLSYTGLIFSPDGKQIFLANVDGSIKVFGIESRSKVVGLFTIPLPPANVPRRKADIPAGIAISPDGKRLYVALNLSNRLLEVDIPSRKTLRSWNVGVAPFDVVLVGDKAYVSNWGGRRPDTDSVTGPMGHGTRVRVDPLRFIANEGSVSVVDLSRPTVGTETQNAKSEILAGLHSSAMAISPNRRWVVVANGGSDTLSVIDTQKDQLVETIWARQSPADLFGAQPNALAFDGSGKRLFVCNGTQNAVAVIDFNPGTSKLLGLVPVGWFPGAIVHDISKNQLYVANIKGLSPGRARQSVGKPEFNSHQYHGSISIFKTPSSRELATLTRTALANMRYPLLKQAALAARPNQPPRPVPERIGEPSVFKHVVYIIKENRTYDQVFGDMKQGNGDPSLCVFGQHFTPNQHKMVRDFVLLDNTYCSGILSADGHQWTDSAFGTDYLERSFAGFPRTYPDLMGDDEVDALAYSPAGFIWDNALAHGKTLRDYGECAITEAHWKDQAKKSAPKFLDFYRDFTSHAEQIEIYSRPGIESLRPYLATNTVGWDLDIPDVFRARKFITELKEFEENGELPNLIIICLPNDHTSGTKPNCPTPAAQVADNDFAFGQIVEALSHSRFWPETCIFAIEDDPQSGWDHVSGYRTTAYVISPSTRRGAVVSTQYNQTSLVRTIELILGLPPMNQLDATATPMFDCFTNVPDLTPFSAVVPNIPLDQMNPNTKRISNRTLRRNAVASARLPLAKPDQCPEDLLNRIIWHAMKGPDAPYPTWAVQTGDDSD